MFGDEVKNEYLSHTGKDEQQIVFTEKIAEQFSSEFNLQQQKDIVIALIEKLIQNHIDLINKAHAAIEENEIKAKFHSEALKDIAEHIGSFINR